MTEEEFDEVIDGGLLSISDAADIGYKVAEMADRLKAAQPFIPGAGAKWKFTMDGVSFDVHVSLTPST